MRCKGRLKNDKKVEGRSFEIKKNELNNSNSGRRKSGVEGNERITTVLNSFT